MNNRTMLAAALFVGAIALAQTVHAETVYVDDDNCPGPGSGTEVDPFCSIQTAIDNAADTDEIIVAPGTYYETIDFLGKAVTLRSANGPAVTIIDAQHTGSVVVCRSGEGPETVLEGFTATGGIGTPFLAGPDVSLVGGGMFNLDSSPTVRDCVFESNTADFGGGGLYNRRGQPTVTGCTFRDNTAEQHGGGIFSSTLPDTTWAVTHCTFSGNRADTGAGMDNHDGRPAVIGCVFLGNTANVAGGGMVLEKGSPTLTGCTFSMNTAPNAGGGLVAASGSNVTMSNCVVAGNRAAIGGGMVITADSVVATNCTFAGNTATGGGQYIGGGVYCAEPYVTLANCILWGNAPNQIGEFIGGSVVSSSTVQGGWSGPGQHNLDADPLFVQPLHSDNCCIPHETPGCADADCAALVCATYPVCCDAAWHPACADEAMLVCGEVCPPEADLRLLPGSPCIDAGDNTAVPDGVTTDLDGNPRFLDVPETPDTGVGDPPIVDMGAYESLGGGCLAITSIETVCHGDGSTFTVNIEGLNACTGGTTTLSFTGAGGDVGENLCATMIVNLEQGGFCCSTQVCVPVPDCSGAIALCDLDGDGIVGVLDFLALLSAWGPNPGHPADLNFDGEVGVGDFLILLAAWNE